MLAKIEALRKRVGLTQGELESAAKLSANRISKWKDGTGEPTAAQALRLARALGVTVESLIDDDLVPDVHRIASRVRVLEIIDEIGWDAAWARLIRDPSIVGPTKKVNVGEYEDVPIKGPDSPRNPRKSGSG